MRIFPRITLVQRWGFHNEFLDESKKERVVHRRSRNPITYLLKDVIRSKLKIKNLGLEAVPLYEREIAFYKMRGYQFTTVRDYCVEAGLL